jgi:hypothetical protein
MKKIKRIYWITTVVFAAFMLFSAIPDILMQPEALKFITELGYPVYFILLLSYAKVLGAIALLIPGFPRIKEWAYAGFFFDLIGAIVSLIAAKGFEIGILILLLPLVLAIISLVYSRKIYPLTNN